MKKNNKSKEPFLYLQLINIHVPVDNPVCLNIYTKINVIYLKVLFIEENSTFDNNNNMS